jgi:hypothetical protein
VALEAGIETEKAALVASSTSAPAKKVKKKPGGQAEEDRAGHAWRRREQAANRMPIVWRSTDPSDLPRVTIASLKRGNIHNLSTSCHASKANARPEPERISAACAPRASAARPIHTHTSKNQVAAPLNP